ncbi:MAG: ABC transporter ATP-binding protein [Arenicella sp.]
MSLFIKNMTVGYGQQTIVSDIQLPEVSAGSLVAVIGANAVGKSTLLKSLAGLLKYTGHASFETQQLGFMTHRQRINTIGYLPQTLPQATTLVAYELVYCACKASQTGLSSKQVDERIEQVFESLGIYDLALRKMCEMSGGQRQMIGLAQVLVRQPKLLLLDEPTSALDLHWQLNVLGAIRQQTQNQNAIALVASHDLNLALRFCDQLLILAGGRVLAMGKPRDALTPANLRSAYGIEGRIESCSQGHPIVLADRAC